MPFQIRHDEYGHFQGIYKDMSFWIMTSNVEFMGVFEFKEKEYAEKTLATLSVSNTMDNSKLHIEEFDSEFNNKIKLAPVNNGYTT